MKKQNSAPVSSPSPHYERIPTKAGGWVIGQLPEGCQFCIQGRKLVFFMGGDCSHPPHCHWYCPISPNRRQADAYFADELAISSPDNPEAVYNILINEVKMIGGKGMSFTGGDPLSSLTKCDRVLEYIRGMKAQFGPEFHIHLYTNGTTFNALLADRLDEAGLDELRFHPAREDFSKLELAIGHRYKVGAEVPVIPTQENHRYLLDLADYLNLIGADFLNLNEFEMCEPNAEAIKSRNFCLASDSLSAVAGSKEYAEKFFDELPPNLTFPIHFCTVNLKDGVQLRNRYLARANTIKRPCEEISDDGCLLFLRVEGPPSEINELYQTLRDESGLPMKLMDLSETNTILDLPPGLANDEDFVDLLSQYQVKAGVIEGTPFREPENFQICEYDPIQDQLPNLQNRRKKKSK
jgi:pyruvate formate-lyase activating enzyme-like uncharacterized protein